MCIVLTSLNFPYKNARCVFKSLLVRKGVNQLVRTFSDIMPRESIASSVPLFSVLGISSTSVWLLGKETKRRFER